MTDVDATAALADLAAIAPAPGGGVLVTADGEVETVGRRDLAGVMARSAIALVHAPLTAQRLGVEPPGRRAGLYDAAELFAFVFPARFCLPTPAGLARALGLPAPETPEDAALAVLDAVSALVAALGRLPPKEADRALAIAEAMALGGWAWGPIVVGALSAAGATRPAGGRPGYDVFADLREWEERGQPPAPGTAAISVDAVEARLVDLLGDGAEERPEQRAFARAATLAFQPREAENAPRIALAEAGTGVGKTLGYVAPASVWAEDNQGAAWLSTYTKNLQRQLDQEIARLYPDPRERAERTVVLKGRENYLCLLNFEQAVAGMPGLGRSLDRVALGLVARWIGATRDGDVVGGDFPAWLGAVIGDPRAAGLTDRRGECVFAACPHYRRCFIEKVNRKARRARLVVANHALVMARAAVDRALGPSSGATEDGDGAGATARYVFDEGHHLFDAADGAFSARLSGVETAELRRWVRGVEGRSGRRGRGLEDRIGAFVEDSEAIGNALDAARRAAAALPTEGWTTRIASGQPSGAAEAFLARVLTQVRARAEERALKGEHDLECAPHPAIDGLLEAASTLRDALEGLRGGLAVLAAALRAKLDDEMAEIETRDRTRLAAIERSLARRAMLILPAWVQMLDALSGETPAGFLDWFSLSRVNGRAVDVGLHRHWIDPTIPFASEVLMNAHGALVTSATLRDAGAGDDDPDGWRGADARTGARWLGRPALHTALASPFDHAARTRVLVVGDVRRGLIDEAAAAYRELFLAAGGGAIGLFTAISRLRGVHARITAPLEAAGLPLYAQHVDAVDAGTLVDIFRAEENACLLGTDAVRDGVDAPGRTLRLLVFDKTPWPRPDLLHRARRAHFGARVHDDAIARLKLRQAYGRLMRRADDRGVFVVLDPMTPTRLFAGFPEGVEIERVGIAEAVRLTRDFLAAEAGG